MQSAFSGGTPLFLRHAVLTAHIRVKCHEILTKANAQQVTVTGTIGQWHIQICMAHTKTKPKQ
jgi:hypothetical protein